MSNCYNGYMVDINLLIYNIHLVSYLQNNPDYLQRHRQLNPQLSACMLLSASPQIYGGFVILDKI